MKKILFLIAALTAASLSFAGGDKNCGDKAKCEEKCDKPCCKDAKAEKGEKSCCKAKADECKDEAKADTKTEKK